MSQRPAARGSGIARRDFGRRLAAGGAGALLARSASGAIPPVPVPPAAPEERFWSAVRDQFLVPRDVVLLNAANLCPAPAPVLEAVYNASDLDHDLSPDNRARMAEAKEGARSALAAFLGASPEEILITRNTSESNNLVSSGLDLRPGDEVVAFSDNHASHLAAWQDKARRFGFTVRVVEARTPHPGPEHYVTAFASALTSRTKVLALTHLTNTVGDLLPVAELCRLARERGVLSAVDGAQSFGLMSVDLRAIQPDFYSGSGHKWLCGPKETGVLYVRQQVQHLLWPSVVSLYPGAVGASKTLEGFGQRDEAAIHGLAEAVRFQTRLGRAAIEARARELAAALREGLARIDGITLSTHPAADRSHAVVSFSPGRLDPRQVAAALYRSDRVVCAVRPGPDRPGLRFAPHFYNLHEEVDRVLAAVRRLVAAGA